MCHGSMNKKNLRNFLETSALGRVILMPYRLKIAFSYYHEPILDNLS
jgi:hypothetical protein